MRKVRNLLLLFILLFSFISIPPVDGEVSSISSPDTGGVAASIASEEENIDSFDVNPKSGRWNVTNDNNTDDLVTDSILRMTTINNLTSDGITDPVGYEMNRGLTKTDGKVEYRMAASGGGNQTEFFRDVIGDKADFDEGDSEGFTLNGAGSTSVDNGIFTVVTGAAAAFGGMDSITDFFSYPLYHTIEFKFKADSVFDAVVFLGRDGGFIKSLFFTTETDWTIESLTIDREFDRFHIRKNNVAEEHTFYFEYIKVIGDLDYATHIEGEIEDTWDWEVDNSTENWTGTGVNNLNVSEGFLRGTMAVGAFAVLDSPANLNIDTDLFNLFIIRMNTSDTDVDFEIRAKINAGFESVTSVTSISSTSQTIYTFDLSDDSDWEGTCTQLEIKFTEPPGVFEGDEIVFIDYILLLGHWDDSESVIGLFDQDNLRPLLNVSTVFTSDNSHAITSDKAYFTVELLDLDNEVAYLATSDNFTDVSDLWIEVTIRYDVLRSRLTVTIAADNGTRIDKWIYPADFTEVSGRIPSLFSHEKAPAVFTSTFSQAISWQEMKLDYIRAPFKEREWTQVSTPTDPNWLADRWDFARAQDNIDDVSAWRLNIPSLDSLSGIMSFNTTNNTLLQDGDTFTISFAVFGVDADDGDAHELIKIRYFIQTVAPPAPPAYGVNIRIFTNETKIFEKTTVENNPSNRNDNPSTVFSMTLTEDRSTIGLKAQVFMNKGNLDEFEDIIASQSLSGVVEDPSQEFILETRYDMDFDGDVEAVAVIESFAWFERDRLTGFPGQVEAPTATGGGGTNWLAMIFIELGRFIADAFGFILSPLFVVLGTLITGIGDVVGGILTAIGGLAAEIAAAVWSGIGSALDFITTAVAAIAADIWTALITELEGIVDDILGFLVLAADVLGDVVFEVLDVLLGLAGDILAGIINFIAGAVFFLWEALGLPDILAILDALLTSVVETITAIPQAIIDLMDFFIPLFIVILALYWFWLVFLAFASAGFDPFAGLAEMFGRLMTTVPIPIPLSGNLPFPIALFFIPLTYFLILPPESVFAIW